MVVRLASREGYGGAIIADAANHRIRQVSRTGLTVTVAGSDTMGHVDSAGSAARFRGPAGITRDGEKYLVTEVGNGVIREVKVVGGELGRRGSQRCRPSRTWA